MIFLIYPYRKRKEIPFMYKTFTLNHYIYLTINDIFKIFSSQNLKNLETKVMKKDIRLTK